MSGITLSRPARRAGGNVRVQPENIGINIKFEVLIIKKESRNANKPDYEPKRNRTIESTNSDKIR